MYRKRPTNIQKLYPPTYSCESLRFHQRIGGGEYGAVFTIRNAATRQIEKDLVAKRPIEYSGEQAELHMTTTRRRSRTDSSSTSDNEDNDLADAQTMRNEFELSSIAKGQNIANVQNFTYIQNVPCILMQKYDGCLAQLVLQDDCSGRNKHQLNNLEKLSIILQCVNAVFQLQHLEPQKIIHRDIKVDNYLFTKVPGGYRVVLCDLGFAYLFDPTGPQPQYFEGSMMYSPPEALQLIIDRLGYHTLKSDIYSLGILMVEVWTGARFYFASDEEELLKMIVIDKKRPPIPMEVMKSPLGNLVHSCLSPDESMRPSIDEVHVALQQVIDKIRIHMKPMEAFIARINPGDASDVEISDVVRELGNLLMRNTIGAAAKTEKIAAFSKLVTDRQTGRVPIASLQKANLEIGPVERLHGWVPFLDEIVRLQNYNFFWNEPSRTSVILNIMSEGQYILRNNLFESGSLRMIVCRQSRPHEHPITLCPNGKDFYYIIGDQKFGLLSNLVEVMITLRNLRNEAVKYKEVNYSVQK